MGSHGLANGATNTAMDPSKWPFKCTKKQLKPFKASLSLSFSTTLHQLILKFPSFSLSTNPFPTTLFSPSNTSSISCSTSNPLSTHNTTPWKTPTAWTHSCSKPLVDGPQSVSRWQFELLLRRWSEQSFDGFQGRRFAMQPVFISAIQGCWISCWSHWEIMLLEIIWFEEHWILWRKCLSIACKKFAVVSKWNPGALNYNWTWKATYSSKRVELLVEFQNWKQVLRS